MVLSVRVLRWINSKIRKDVIRSEDITDNLGLTSIREKWKGTFVAPKMW